jgi:hypothetical protein
LPVLAEGRAIGDVYVVVTAADPLNPSREERADCARFVPEV